MAALVLLDAILIQGARNSQSTPTSAVAASQEVRHDAAVRMTRQKFE
jgi:hypothetical protein